jgi:hypothetical protein
VVCRGCSGWQLFKEKPVRRLSLLAWLFTAGACADGSLDQARLSDDAELIPAEWTVAEDTALNGEVVTTSLQLPAARDIAGLMQDESPRVILRCVRGEVAVYLETDLSAEPASTGGGQVPIQLDSAPSCE